MVASDAQTEKNEERYSHFGRPSVNLSTWRRLVRMWLLSMSLWDVQFLYSQ